MEEQHKESGFTLIELLIVVAIVGIIAAIAYPSYQEYVERTRRVDAQGVLMEMSAAMERYYATNNSYGGAAAAAADTGAPAIFPDEAPLESDQKYYDLTIESADATSYTLRATPKGVQAGNGNLELDSTGVRRWDVNDDGFDSGDNTWDQ
ncbi:type IV pilin protein [Marinobacter sediminum]|uniref:type IV pilin protein n=1 Tax=Marinobacter sediminum TaxID=256323 RepID=UPI00202DF1A2|nr:type IV pilin protein [Marinobacter sediminum]